jgi:predicted phage terminase large subunit-like protein
LERQAKTRSSETFTGGYTPWLESVSPRHFPDFNWHYPHITAVREALARVTRGECKRLILSLPPQHGKTSVLTIPYPVYRLCRNPRLRVAVGAYNQTHANRFSRKARRIGAECLELSRERKAMNEWETAQGGYYVAVGKGAGITGLPVDLLVIDDPHKDAAEAMSATERENAWQWWTDALFTRLSKDAAVVVVQTRWHTEDLAGRLQAQGGWESVVFTGIAEEGDILGRAPGEALCPELHPIEQLLEARKNNPNSFEALYQQKPLDLTGGFFRGLERVQIVGAAPVPDQFTKRVRAWDLASTEDQAGADPDWTAGVLMGKHKDGTFWVLDVVRARLGPRGVRDLIKQTAQSDGRGVQIRIEREGGASGKLAAQSIITEDLAGWSAQAVKPKGSKSERAEPWGSQIEAGNVRVVRNSFTAAFLDEHRAFPSGKHDDMVDAASLGLAECARAGVSFTSFEV